MMQSEVTCGTLQGTGALQSMNERRLELQLSSMKQHINHSWHAKMVDHRPIGGKTTTHNIASKQGLLLTERQ